MLVSLCVIARDEEQFLPMLLQDIKAQEYPHKNIEVIMIDSLSKDKTTDIMEDFEKNHQDFYNAKKFTCYGNCQAASWNVALENAIGDVIIRVDAHASIPKDFVAKCVQNLQNGEDVVGGGRPNKVLHKTPWNETLLAAEECMFGGDIAGYRRQQTEKKYMNTVFHGAYRKEVLASVGGFNEDLGRTEDNEFHFRICQRGYKICCCPDIISYQYIRSTLGGMINQKYGNGLWIGLTTGVCPKCLSYFYFAPLLLVLGFLVCGILSICGFPVLMWLLAAVYLLFDLFITATAFVGRKCYVQFLLLPFIFPLLHISYGIGTVAGLIKMPFWRKKDNKAQMRIDEIKEHYKEIL